jgi:hypothetical protein
MKSHYTTTFIFVIFFCLNTNHILFAQDYGLKFGTNWTCFKGQIEKDINGNALESFKPAMGFQIGFTSNYPFSDNTGLRVEMLYAQKCVNFSYDGEATKYFYTQNTNRRIIAKGHLTSNLKIKNDYFEVPITFYIKTENQIEFGLGVNFAFLANSKGDGEMTFTGNTEGGYAIPQFTAKLDYNYSRDKDTTAALSERVANVEEGGTVRLPETLGAYYENRTSEHQRFNTIDIGLIGDLKYWLSDGLAIGGRVVYSLKDVTNNESDFSQNRLDPNKNLNATYDYDKFLTYQLSLIFKF